MLGDPELTSEAECVEDKLRAVENCEAGVVLMFVLAVFKALKVFGVPSRADLSDLKQVH